MITVAFLVNDGREGPLGHRAREFARRFPARYDVRIAYRDRGKISSLLLFFLFLLRTRPAAGYVFDIGYSGALAALLYKLISSMRLIIETGDAVYELARTSGMRGPVGL